MLCDDAILFDAFPSAARLLAMPFVALSIAAAAWIGVVVLHELGHAAAGWSLGGDMRPTGFGGGPFTGNRSFGHFGGRWRVVARARYPHVRFDFSTGAGAGAIRFVMAGGIVANLLTPAVLWAALGLVPGSLSDLAEGLDAVIAFTRGGCASVLVGDAAVPVGAALGRFFLVFLGNSSILFAAINLVPRRLQDGFVTDGYQLLRPGRR